MVSTEQDNDALLEQYRQVNEDQKKLVELIWQEPTVIVTIASALVIVAYYYVTDDMCDANLQSATTSFSCHVRCAHVIYLCPHCNQT